MRSEIKSGIWKISADSNIYLIKGKGIVIDTGFRQHRSIIAEELQELIDLDEVRIVIFTHLHMDHIGNFDLFPNAHFYASQAAIQDLESDRISTVLDPSIASIFNADLIPLEGSIEGIRVINTPGHTNGSVCLLYDGVLFTGDTRFENGFGRTDLPTSDPEELTQSLKTLESVQYEVLAPGHDY